MSDKCNYARWMKFLAKIKDKKRLVQVKAVNKFMNRAKYIVDKNNWGKKE